MSSNAKSLGIVGAARKFPIKREDVRVERRPAGRFQPRPVIAVDISGIDAGMVPAKALVEIVVKSSETNARDYHPVGAFHEIDRANIRCPIGTTVSGRGIGIFVRIADPDTHRILGASERFTLTPDNANAEGAGSDAPSGSLVFLRIDPNQRVPMLGLIEDAGPVVSFGRNGPSSPSEAKIDVGVLASGLPQSTEKFIHAMLDDEEGALCSPRWVAFKQHVAERTKFDDWDALAAAYQGRKSMQAAQELIGLYLVDSRLEAIVDSIMKNAANIGTAEQE